VHAFTPAASRTGKWIAVATRRTSIRHIEIFDLEAKKFLPISAHIHPSTHHYNPFVSPSSNRIGYHRCRGVDEGDETVDLRVEYQRSPLPGVSVVRVEGGFPVMSPDGSLVAYVDSNDQSADLAVMKLDGSQRRVEPGQRVRSELGSYRERGRVCLSWARLCLCEHSSEHHCSPER
jgi:tricorn protease-like protein